jgi:hypothetical protein
MLSQERFYGGDSTIVSVEALVGLDLSAFRFDTPKLDFSTSAFAYPSLTELGRVRMQVDSRVKYEVLKDFYLGLRFSDSFDSKPPESGASRNDFTTDFTIGFYFRQ